MVDETNYEEFQYVECQIIRRKSNLTLVQWEEDGTPMRAWIVPSMIQKENSKTKTAMVRNPKEGVPHGVSWEDYLPEPNVTPAVIDRELKRRGIWTIEDLQAKPEVARQCLQRAYGLDLATLLRAAARQQKADGGSS